MYIIKNKRVNLPLSEKSYLHQYQTTILPQEGIDSAIYSFLQNDPCVHESFIFLILGFRAAV